MVGTTITNPPGPAPNEKTSKHSHYRLYSPPGRGEFGVFKGGASDLLVSSPTIKSRIAHNLNVESESNAPLEALTDSESELDEEDDVKMYDDFDIQGVSKEELAFWSQLAPADQKLVDAEISAQKSQPQAKESLGTFKLCFYW